VLPRIQTVGMVRSGPDPRPPWLKARVWQKFDRRPMRRYAVIPCRTTSERGERRLRDLPYMAWLSARSTFPNKGATCPAVNS
jgi:hypothetical protein